jgi:hypothetical protein
MKKFLLISLSALALFAVTPKDNKFFVGFDAGKLKIRDSSTIYGGKIGYYFYDKNRFLINNRIYIDFKKVDSSADFYIYTANIDWIKNTGSINPYVGLNVGYLSFEQGDVDESSGVWGFNAGAIFYILDNFGIEILFKWQKSFNKKNIWDRALKTIEGNIEFSF